MSNNNSSRIADIIFRTVSNEITLQTPVSIDDRKHKVALITGITGQDGSYLAELLLSKDYIVYGIVRRSSTPNTSRIDHLYPKLDSQKEGRLRLRYGDLTDSSSVCRIFREAMPDEVYNLAAQSHVKVSFDVPEDTANADALGVIRILDVIKLCGMEKRCKFYQASTSELYGSSAPPQSETTPFMPRSPYACAKLYGFHIVKNYREAYGMFACNGILFNHESPRRGNNFVTRKITRSVAQIHLGQLDRITLGNLNSIRDWGHAQDYVRGMWMILQADEPVDYVLATGVECTVRRFTEMAFAIIGKKLVWSGEDEDEVGKCADTGDILVDVSPVYYRPTEVEYLLGDSSKARKNLGWKPEITLEQMCEQMVKSDIELMKENAKDDQ